MKTKVIRLVSMLLALCMCLTVLPQLAPEANALTLGYTPSTAYKASKYYTSLLNVELTGNQAEDIVNVALSQAGYCEGSYSGDTGGDYDSSFLNYVEYNYWYHNYVNSNMPVGGSYAHWCATFVSWCAEQAGVPTSILQRSTAAGHSSGYFNIYFYAGGSTLNSSADNNYHFLGYNYNPKKGDLFYTRDWGHVGLVVSSDGTYVTTIEGNTNDGGSADGYGVFKRTRKISSLYFGVPEYEDNSVKEYVGTCTYYPSHCQLNVTNDTPINTQPRSVNTEDNSTTLFRAQPGQTYTATALYQNTFGNYWYRIETDYDETAYIFAGDATVEKHLISDITITDYAVPNGHVQGDSFGLDGTISSQYNQLSAVACNIYDGFGLKGTVKVSYSDPISAKEYVLWHSDVDYGIPFGSLACGNYTYQISADYISYYAPTSTTVASHTGTTSLLQSYFVVIPTAVDQSTCAHSNTTVNLGGNGCTQPGSRIDACSICGLVTKTEVSVVGHSYGDWITVGNTKSRTCSVCGHTESETLPSTCEHDYQVTFKDATCANYATYEYTCSFCGDSYKVTAQDMMSIWLESIPEEMDASLFTTKTQYRYADAQTVTSYEPSLTGYTVKSTRWVEAGSKSVEYVKEWSDGFSEYTYFYPIYHKIDETVTESETETTKTVVNSDEITGYLYHHWCYGETCSQTYKNSNYVMHAYYSTTPPESSDIYDSSDGSYYFSNSACSTCLWWWPTEVYTQESTTYNKEYTYQRWSEFSQWSDTAVSASDTRKVETRTLYQLKSTELGDHSYSSAITKDPTCTEPGIKTFTCSGCGDSYTESIDVTGHSYDAQITEPTCTTPGYTTFTCTECGHSYIGDNVDTAPHEWLSGYCFNCGEACEHNYVDHFCSICGMEEPATDYYLFGYINGVDYACEADYANMGEYQFVDGKLVVTFDTDSYVGVKTSGNGAWYFTHGWLGFEETTATLYERSATSAPDKLYVPGGVEITFTLTVNDDGTLTLSYEAAQKIPTLELKYPTLLLEDEIIMSVYFTMDQEVDLNKVGLLTWNSQPTNISYATADAVIPGAVFNSNGLYSVNTGAIPAKNLGDTIYFCIYVQMDNGSYVYGKQVQYSPRQFAYSQLSSNASAETKSLMVAMLNYGAQAQVYFDYKTSALVNQDLTSEQKALVKAYDSTMMDRIDLPDTSKTGPYAATGGFDSKYPTVSLEGAFAINYYFTTSYVPDANVMLFYWTEADYQAAATLSPANATGKISLDGTNVFTGIVEGIPAQDLDDTIYVVAGYRSGGVSYCTGVLPYSIGAFCVSQASSGGEEIKPLASTIAVYGYYAKAYFASL